MSLSCKGLDLLLLKQLNLHRSIGSVGLGHTRHYTEYHLLKYHNRYMVSLVMPLLLSYNTIPFESSNWIYIYNALHILTIVRRIVYKIIIRDTPTFYISLFSLSFFFWKYLTSTSNLCIKRSCNILIWCVFNIKIMFFTRFYKYFLFVNKLPFLTARSFWKTLFSA